MKVRFVYMNISENIPLDVDLVLAELSWRQHAQWNGNINEKREFPRLRELFRIINSGIPKEDFFYKGDLFRIHPSRDGLYGCIDLDRYRIVSGICDDGSCWISPITQYTDKLVSYSKSPDYTTPVWYKVWPRVQNLFLHVQTGGLYGIDVNALFARFGFYNEKFLGEQEVLFPLFQENVVKEYLCTPAQMKYYFRKFSVDLSGDSC